MTSVAEKPLEGGIVSPWRAEFPILDQSIHGHPLVYLDNAATTQKPRAVIDRIRRYYEEENANVHRGLHTLSERATKAYEGAREAAARFIGAKAPDEIVFVRGTTEALNLVAWSHARAVLVPGDEIVLTGMEHHSNIVPWQLVAEERGARLRVVPVTDQGDIRVEDARRIIGARTKIVTLAHISNALGTINPVREVAALAKEAGATVVVDGAQAAPHASVDVERLGCDFYAFSGHKMYGPTGIGVLWGRREILEKMAPWQGGGDMIHTVSFDGTTFAPPPARFEAGTPNIAGAVGLGAAIEWIEGIGIERIAAHEAVLLERATAALREIDGLRLIGTAGNKAAVVSFVLRDAHPHDASTVLDREGVAVRAGHHCAQPLMERFGVPATIRASFAAYNDTNDVDRLVAAVRKVQEIFG